MIEIISQTLVILSRFLPFTDREGIKRHIIKDPFREVFYCSKEYHEKLKEEEFHIEGAWSRKIE